MSDDNKRNILYFENSSMRGLYENMKHWQEANRKRFLSIDVQSDGEQFCCIALTNPSEVVIVDQYGGGSASVSRGCLHVDTG